MGSYTRRVTQSAINALITAETVNDLADLSSVFDVGRYETVFSGASAGNFLALSGEYREGLYLVRVGSPAVKYWLMIFLVGSSGHAASNYINGSESSFDYTLQSEGYQLSFIAGEENIVFETVLRVG